ncbi:hypothetical protein AbraCBS73388_009897 [Aspergillus brasiliensis]|uniref:Cytochrome P450 n=1 Tax=Aspergillus brasiliensis TaxID=319629 RepID=A0A9W5YW30_9EURO|nr:hypothetical protein AbraCBS73388_009897 [Aspergillus brasiliensis]
MDVQFLMFLLKSFAWAFLPVRASQPPSGVLPQLTEKQQYSVICVIYNLFFHPLKDYPGPRIMAASRLPIFFLLLIGRSATSLAKLHAKYGPVVRVAPNELSYTAASAWKDIYSSTAAHPLGITRNMVFFRAMAGEHDVQSLITANNKDHARMRRAYARAFSKQALAAQEPLIMQHIDKLIKKLHAGIEHTGKPVDINKYLNLALFDMMNDLQFGEPLHLLDDATYRPFAFASLIIVPSAAVISALADFPVARVILKPILREVMRMRRLYFTTTDERLNERLASKSYRADIVQFLTETQSDNVTAEEIRANAPLMNIAGSGTSAVALSGLIAHLLLAPHILTQLQDAVRSRFRTSSNITMKTMARDMHLLDACIKEILRVFPAVPVTPSRLVTSPGATIAGKWVAGGTVVYVTPLAAFHSADNFHDPETFAPQRWYPATEESNFASKDVKEAYKPFSVGPFNCIGQDMAKYIMSLFICNLLLHFDFEIATDPKTWLSNQRAWIVWHNPPLNVNLKPVKAEGCDVSRD